MFAAPRFLRCACPYLGLAQQRKPRSCFRVPGEAFPRLAQRVAQLGRVAEPPLWVRALAEGEYLLAVHSLTLPLMSNTPNGLRKNGKSAN